MSNPLSARLTTGLFPASHPTTQNKMATLRCPCGQLLNNRSIVNEVEGYLLTSQDIEQQAYSNYEDAAEWAIEAGRGAWECSSCGRLAFNWPDRSDATVKWYLPEDGAPGRLMALLHSDDS